jgi:hypothetical protein
MHGFTLVIKPIVHRTRLNKASSLGAMDGVGIRVNDNFISGSVIKERIKGKNKVGMASRIGSSKRVIKMNGGMVSI